MRPTAPTGYARTSPTAPITDYDEHGLLIANRLETDAVEWFDEGPRNVRVRRAVEDKGGAPGLAFVRIGITPGQAASYPERQDALGHMQAEGMPVTDMDELVEAEIKERLDMTRLERVMTVAELRQDRLRDLVTERLETRN